MARSKMMKVVRQPDDARCQIALYIRVSTDAQAEEGHSIEAQVEKLTAYAKTITTDESCVTLYIDDGWSGGSLDRPRMNELIEDIKENRITHVIVYKLDRLSRSQRDTLYMIEELFIPNNVEFISLQESFNTATPFGRAVIGILAVFAQLERENIFERTRLGMAKRVEAGYWPGGGMVPYGYDYVQEEGVLKPNSDAESVRLMYELYLQGYSEGMLAKKFNLKYDRLVHQILTRKSNTGVIVYNGVEYPGRHEPIIDLQTYNAVMDMMRDRSERKLVSKTPHLLTGLFECGVCGAKMRYQKWGKDVYKIVCYSQQTSKEYLVKDPDCDNDRADSRDIEEAVLNDIFSMTAEFHDTDKDTPKRKPVIEALRDQLKIAETKIERLYGLYASEGNEYLLKSINTVRAEIDSLKARISEEEEKLAETNRAISARNTFRNLKDYWDIMSDQEQKAAIRSLVEKIIIYPNSCKVQYKI